MFSGIHPLNHVVLGVLAAIVFFGLLVATIPLPLLVIILNGVFIGTMVGVIVAYGPLIWQAVLGLGPYDRVRQMTLGMAACWLAYICTVLISIYVRAAGGDPIAFLLVVAGRYVAILAAILQVTAPNFGEGIFFGRERKTLLLGISLGLFAALAMIYLQDHQTLSEEGTLPLKVPGPDTIGALVLPHAA